MTTMSITESCHIEDSMNVLEGGIASGTEGSNSFMCNNCTFIRNERVDQRAKNTGRLSTTETQSFMNAEWNECSAPCGGALYVRDNSNAKLTIENSSFVKCNATMTRGGGIFALNIAECTVKHSTFVECYCVASTNYGGAGAELEGMRIQVLVENCLFKDGWSGNDGGGLGIWRSNTINSKDCILDCSFVNCNGNDRNSDGGGYISWSATDKVVLRNCLFQGCHSNFQGGAVSILTNGYNGNLLWFCFFHNNTAQYGNDIFVYDNNTHSQIVSCYSSRTEGVRYYADGDKSVWLPNNGGECRFVSSKLTQPYAKDTYSCGLNESCACLTISHCLTQMISGFVNEIKVLSGTVVEGKCVEISSGAIIIHGHSVSGTIAKTEFESIGLNLFSVENGSETVTDMSIIHDSSSVAGRNSLLFRVKGTGLMELRRLNISMDSMHSNKTQMLTAFVRLDSGEIKMNEVKWGQAFSKTSLFYFPLNTITSLQFDNCSFYKFLKASDGSSLLDSSDCSVDITMSKCVIDGCRSTISKKGGALKIKIGSAGCLKVDNTAVRNCIASTTAGRGGGIFMTVSEENADYSITASFTDNEARWGSDIFVDSTNLESTAKGGRISSLSASNATFNKIRGFDGGDVRVNIPLCVYLIPLPDELVVSNEDAFDHLYCGFVEFPCLTLKHTLERKEGEINICVSGMIKMADEVKMESTKCAIRGQTEGSGWIVLDDDNGIELSLVKVKAETLFEQLLFSLPSKMQKHNIFISVQSATILTMEECSASTKNTGTELSFAFMEVTSGTVNITQFSANSISLADFPLISLGGARTFGIIDRLEMDEASLTANCELINIQNSASMSVSNSRITGKKVEQRNLLLSFRFLSTISGNSVSLVNCSIKGFSSFEKNGGAIECVLESECSFEVVGGLMENSECIGRNGGGMCVEMKEGSWFSIGNVSNVKTKNEEDSKSYRNGATGLKNCTSIRSEEGNGGCGGGLCLLLVGNASDFFLKEVMFEECGADAGKNVFVNSNNLFRAVNKFSFALSINEEERFSYSGIERETAGVNLLIPLDLYLKNLSLPIFINGTEGADFSACGFMNYPCRSLNISSESRFGSQPRVLLISQPFAFDEEFVFDDQEWRISSSSCISSNGFAIISPIELVQDELMITKASSYFNNIMFNLSRTLNGRGSLFRVDSDNLNFNKCGIQSTETEIGYGFARICGGKIFICNFSAFLLSFPSSSLFNINSSSASLAMGDSQFEKLQFSSDSIVKGCNSGMNVTNCAFNAIRSLQGNGSCIFMEEISEELSNIVLNNVNFTNDSAEGNTSYGGAIYLNYHSPIELSLRNILFINCSAYKAKFLFMIGKDLNGTICLRNFDFDFDTFANVENAFVGNDTNDERIMNFDLLRFLIVYSSNSTFISDEGIDVSRCGSINEPCESLFYGKLHLSVNSFTICVCSNLTLRSKEELSGYELRSYDSSTANIIVPSSFSNAVGCVMINYKTIKLSRLRFIISGQLPNSIVSIILSENSSQSTGLYTINFAIEGGSAFLNCSLMTVLSGFVTLANCSFIDLHFAITPFVLFEGVTFVRQFSAMNKMNDVSVLVSFDNCSFINVTSTVSNGTLGIIVTKENEKTFISNCTFLNDNLINDNTNGGGFYSKIYSNGFCKIGDCSFDNCSASELNGRGGAFFMKVIENETNRFQLKDLSFEFCNAQVGKNIFVECDDLEFVAPLNQFDFYLPTINIDECLLYFGTRYQNDDEPINLFTYWTYHGDSIYLSLEHGEDSFLCGSKTFPCKSNEFIRNKFEKDASSAILYVDSSYSITSKIIFVGELENRGLHGFCSVGSSDSYPVPVTIGYSAPTGEERLDSLFSSSGNITIGGFLFDLEKVGYVCVIRSTDGFLKIRECDFRINNNSKDIGILAKIKGELIVKCIQLYGCGEVVRSEAVLFVISHVLSSMKVEDVSIDGVSIVNGDMLQIIDDITPVESFNEDLKLNASKYSRNFIFQDNEQIAFEVSNISFKNIVFSSTSVVNSFRTATSEKASVIVRNLNFCNVTHTGVGSLINLDSVDISINNSNLCSCFILSENEEILSATDSIMKLYNCSISCVSDRISSINNKENQEHFSCRFEGSLVTLKNCISTINFVTFKNSSAGALIIIGGYANLIECEFINNAINSVGYTSVRRNILCDSGALSFDSYSDESGIKDPNLLLDGEYLEMWIQNSGCSINSSLNWSSEESGDLSEETLKEFPQKTYLFCRPHVLTTMRIDEDDKTIIHFKGNNLLPCLVSYELFSLNVSDENARMQEISLSFVTCTYINQDENAIETSKSQLQSAFDLTNIQIWVRAVLSLKENALSKKHSNGVRVIKTEPVLLQDVIEQPNDTSKSSAKAFPWWIILIIVGVLIIAVIIAVIVIVKKKRSNKWKGIEIRDINEECEEKGLTGMNENDKQGIAINPVNKTISKRDNSSIVIQSSKVSNVDGDGINKKQLNNSSPASTNPFENTPGLANDSPNEEYNECSSADISGNSSFLESFESLYPNGQNTDNLSFKQGSTDLLSVSSTAALLANENNSVAQSLDLSQSNNGFMSKNFSVAENDSFSDELKEDIMSKLLMTSMMRNALPKNEITGDSQDVLTEISAACPAFASHENIDLKRDSEQMANPSQRKRKKKGKKGTHRRGAKLNDVQPENEKEETGCEGILLKNTVAMVEKNNGSDNIESVNFKSPEYYHASSSASSTPFSLFGDDDKATEDSELKQCNNLSENTKNIIRTDTILDDTVSVNTLSASFKQTTPDNPVDSAQSGQGEVNTRCCNMESENPPVADGERKQERLRKKKKKKKVEKSTSEQSGDPAIHVNNNIEEQEQKETDQFSALNAVHDKSSSDQNCSVEKPKDGDSEALNAHNFTDIKSDKEQTKENAINSPEEFLVNENIIPDKLKKKKKKKKKKLQKQQKEESNGELPDVNSTLFDESKNEKFSSSEGPTVTKTDIFDI